MVTESPAIQTSKTAESVRLARAAHASDAKMKPGRERRHEFMRHFAGPFYGPTSEDTGWRQPLNLIFSMVSTIEPVLAMKNLRASVTTPKEDIRPFANQLKTVLDWTLRKIKAARSVREAIPNALYGVGLLKTGWDGTDKLPFCDTISMDDYLFDYRARERKSDSYCFEGHKFRIDYEQLMDSGRLKAVSRPILETIAKDQWQHDGKARGQDIAFGKAMYSDEAFRPQVELAEFYLPQDKRVVWLPGNLQMNTDHYLWEDEHYGHEDGPYDLLGFSYLPDNVMPVPLVGIVFDLYMLLNELARKVARQAENQKDVALIDSKEDKDVERLQKAADGSFLRVQGAKGTVLSLGGANQQGYQAVAWFQDWFSRVAGNTDLLGGLTSQSKTLGQEQMLMGNSMVRVNDMRNRVEDLARAVVEKIGWYVWNDDSLSVDLSYDVGHGQSLPVAWRPKAREGKVTDFDFDLDVYSSASESPEDRVERLGKWLERFVMPLAPLAAQQGSQLNLDLMMNLAARDLDIPEKEDLWKEAPPIESPAPVAAAGQQGAGARAPAPSTGRMPQRPIESMAVPAGAS